MYAETDFLLARTTDEDWIGRGDAVTVVAATTYVEDHGFTPFDALHLVESGGDTVVSSDEAYDSFAPRIDPGSVTEE